MWRNEYNLECMELMNRAAGFPRPRSFAFLTAALAQARSPLNTSLPLPQLHCPRYPKQEEFFHPPSADGKLALGCLFWKTAPLQAITQLGTADCDTSTIPVPPCGTVSRQGVQRSVRHTRVDGSERRA